MQASLWASELVCAEVSTQTQHRLKLASSLPFAWVREVDEGFLGYQGPLSLVTPSHIGFGVPTSPQSFKKIQVGGWRAHSPNKPQSQV